MNPTVDNDLQKAIDDITKNANGDPIFSDPVAAPSSIPEGDLGTIAEAVGPFPAEAEAVEPILPQLTAEQAAMNPIVDALEPLEPIAPEVVSESTTETFSAGPISEPPMPEPIIEPIAEAPVPFPEPTMPEPIVAAPAIKPVAPTIEPIHIHEQPAADQSPEAYISASLETITSATSDAHSIKEAALRDLAPLMDKIDMDPAKRFELYKYIREKFNDDSVLASAYESAKDIADEKARGEALLYIFESIKD